MWHLYAKDLVFAIVLGRLSSGADCDRQVVACAGRKLSGSETAVKEAIACQTHPIQAGQALPAAVVSPSCRHHWKATLGISLSNGRNLK
jgi:hypothetical protein